MPSDFLRERRLLLAFAVAVVILGVVPSALGVDGELDPGSAAVEPNAVPGAYVVQLAESPVVAYEGGIAGLPSTKPGKGQKINPRPSRGS